MIKPSLDHPKIQATTDKVMNRLKQSQVAEMSKIETDLLQHVMQPLSEQRAKIPEPLFVQNFLPIFSGEKPLNENPDLVAMWIGIARSPTSEVDVIDEANQVLFTVPGFYDTTVINAMSRVTGTTSESRRDLGNIVDNYVIQKNNIPKLAEDRVNLDLSEKAPTLFKESEKYQDNKQKWGIIFDRYGLNKNQNKQAFANDNAAEEIEYD